MPLGGHFPDLQFKCHAVISEINANRQIFTIFESDFMGKVCKNRPLGVQFFDDFLCAFDIEVGVVGCIAQRINDEKIQASEHSHGWLGNVTDIGKVSQAADTVPGGIDMAMDEGNRHDVEAEQLKFSGNYVGVKEWSISFTFQSLKNIGKTGGDYSIGLFIGKTRDEPFMDKVEAAQIINAMDVIGMGVCEQYRVYVRNVLAKRLSTKVCGGVNEDVIALCLDEQ